MAARSRGHAPRRAARQGSTAVSARSGRVSYYREGGTRTLKAGSFRGGRTAAGYYTIATPGGQQVAARAPARTYHRFILAEFLGCIAMIAAAMILLPAQGAAEGATPAARSFARELVQLSALCVVFFALALMASGPKTGKVAAAFGGLVTLGVAWNVSGVFSALAKALTGTANTEAAANGNFQPVGIATQQQLFGTYPTPGGNPPPSVTSLSGEVPGG